MTSTFYISYDNNSTLISFGSNASTLLYSNRQNYSFWWSNPKYYAMPINCLRLNSSIS